jgi:hypothetical protein
MAPKHSPVVAADLEVTDGDAVDRRRLRHDPAARHEVDWEARGEGNVTLRREIRLLEDAFGLNPASRARLRWQIGSEGGP